MKEIVFDNESYQISFDPMPSLLKEKLTSQELEHYLELLEKVQGNPKQSYEALKAFCNNHLDIPEVLNLLTFAHVKNRKVRLAESLIEKTYRDHPHYLFARINFADQCLRKKELGKIPQIFPSFDLNELFPGKKVFHVIEFRSFLVFMAFYQLQLKNSKKALDFYEKAKELEPNHPSLLLLEKKLFSKSLFKRLIKRLTVISKCTCV